MMNFTSMEGGKKVGSEFNWRISMSLTKEQEEAILSLRQREEFRRCSLSEIVRRLIDAGLKESEHNAHKGEEQ